MTTYATGNPLGSKDPRDLYDNAENFDAAMNDRVNTTWNDRFGVSRPTMKGYEEQFNDWLDAQGFEPGFLEYVDGSPLTVDRPTQLIQRDGNLYSVKRPADFPVNLTGNWATDQDLLVAQADQSLRQDISNATDPYKGAALVGYRGRTIKSRLDDIINIKDAPYSVKGDNTTEDHNNLIACLDYAAAQGKAVLVPSGTYLFNNWIPLPDKLKLIFDPGAVWKLTANTNLGGFVCGGYTKDLMPRPFTDVEIYNIEVDCSDLPNENGINAINGENIKIYNPKVRNVKFSNVHQGGKAFQFEGAIVDGIHIYNPYIENCTIGINSHADPAGGVEIARNINYYDVVMRNVDVPFNSDGQFANPENGSVVNMYTYVHGVSLFNCGRLTYPGNSGPLGAGIVCGDRGFGLSISGLRLVNTTDYGAIGAVFRGTLFNMHARDFLINAPSVNNVVDLTPVGYGFPSTGSHPCTFDAKDIRVFSEIGLVVKGYAYSKLGLSRFEIEIDSTLGISGICDIEATSSNLGFLDLMLRNTGNFRTKMQALSALFANGNTVNLCMPEYSEREWTPNDASGEGLEFTGVSAYYVREGRRVTANLSITFPTTTSTMNAKIGGLPFASMNRPEAGGAIFSYKAASSLSNGIVRAKQNHLELYSASGIPIPNSAVSGQSLIISINYLT